MSVYNGRRYLREAIESVLRQTFGDFEFLILDDGSSDGSQDIILSYRDPRIRLVANTTNIGLTKSLNRGLARALAPLIARQDADDVSYPNRLEKQVEIMDRHPDVVLVGAQARTIDSGGSPVRGTPWPRAVTDLGMRWQLIFESPFVHTSVMFRREVVWGELGGYDEEFVTSQDYELWSRVARRYRIGNLPDCLVDFRVHPESASSAYTPQNIQRVRQPLRMNAVRYLRCGDIPERWLDLWVAANNPRVYGGDVDIQSLMKFLDAFRTRFEETHPASRDHPEIRRHLAGMLLRIGLRLTPAHPVKSLGLLIRAYRTDPVITRLALRAHLRELPSRIWRR